MCLKNSYFGGLKKQCLLIPVGGSMNMKYEVLMYVATTYSSASTSYYEGEELQYAAIMAASESWAAAAGAARAAGGGGWTNKDLVAKYLRAS